MKLSKPLVSLLVLVLAFTVLVAGLSAVQSRMNAIRIQQELTDTEPLENAPPLVAFTTVALGGFRGLVADFLWLRSQRMQDKGNYFETVQLASWITKLQPRFTAASCFLAWNMAYNVSVTFNRPEDRWRWVQRGIELIRDEALNYNPSDPELFHQLGWIYQHKVGKDLDDANRYYKTQMAWEMKRVFGPVVQGRAHDGSLPSSTERWHRIASGALTPAKLAAQIGEEKYAEFAKILARQGEEGKGWTFDDFEREFRESPDGMIPDIVRQEIVDLGIAIPVDLALRHRWLRNHYRLKPELVAHINRPFGDLDWRLPEAHAIYWAVRGGEEWRKSEDEFKALQCDRMIFQSLADAFKGGSLVVMQVEDTEVLEMRPNLNVADFCRKAYEDALERHGENTIRAAYGNFLVDAVVYFYKSGFRAKAKEYFDIGTKRYESRITGDLDSFAVKELEEDIKIMSYNQGQSTVQGYLIYSCFALANRNYDECAAYERTARSVYDKYHQDIGDTKIRRGLPPYDQMKANVITYCLETFPPELAAVLDAELKAEAERLKPKKPDTP